MLKKSAWMGLLLFGLLALSASAAWAAGINRSVLHGNAASGSALTAKLGGVGGNRYRKTLTTPDRHGHCFMGEDAAAAEAAYW